MAITTYAELKTAIADFLNRDDLASVIPTFVSLAEAQINRDIRHWRMESRVSGQQTGGDAYMQLPADWVETIRFTIGSNPALSLASIDAIADMRSKRDNLSGVPTHYAHVRGEFELYPTPSADTDFELLYYQKIPALSDSNASNWLLEQAVDVYLYGALIHTAPYLADDARLAVWAQMYSAAVANLNSASDSAQYSGSGLKLKVRGLG